MGYCDTTSPKTSETVNCPAPTITSHQMEGGPPVAIAVAKSE